MKLQLVSHASVIVETNQSSIWTDPWLSGTAFNNSWALLPEAKFDPIALDKITHIWISHEHPDHFHIPTLRSLPAAFKERVTVLYQKLNSDKMVNAFKQLGFRKIQLLPHRKGVYLPDGTRLYSYYVGIMDSCLAVTDGSCTVLNANDAQIVTRDCMLIRKDLGPIDTLLTQFSIAFYSGLPDYEDRLRRMAVGILERISGNHQDLRVKQTIPFASLIYYCSEENRYINHFHNRPRDVYDFFRKRNQSVVVLYPGDSFSHGNPKFDSEPAMSHYDDIHAHLEEMPYDRPVRVEFEELRRAFAQFCSGIHERYPSLILEPAATGACKNSRLETGGSLEPCGLFFQRGRLFNLVRS